MLTTPIPARVNKCGKLRSRELKPVIINMVSEALIAIITLRLASKPLPGSQKCDEVYSYFYVCCALGGFLLTLQYPKGN